MSNKEDSINGLLDTLDSMAIDRPMIVFYVIVVRIIAYCLIDIADVIWQVNEG